MEHLVSQLGGLPLPALVREAAALVERHFIDIALARNAGNAAAAALLLGISRDQLVTAQRAGSPAPAVHPAASNDAGTT